jgi:hypothetical protein
MSAVRLSVRGALVLLSCLALVACGGGSGGPGGDGDGGDGGALDPAGAPVNRQQEGEAVASPLKIPEWTERGRPLTDARWQRLEAKFARACGGELCVDLRLRPEPSDTPRERCNWTSFDPPEGATVERGGTIWVICDGSDWAGEQSDGDQSHGGQSDGDQSHGGQSDGGQPDGGQSDGTRDGTES